MNRAEQMVIVGGIAADQWGLVTAKQAATEGVNGVQLKRLTDAGLMENVGRGVYLVTGAGYPQHLEIKIAWLRLAPAKRAWQRNSTDPDSGVISHSSACLLHDLGDIPAGHVEITVPRRRVARDPDVQLRIAHLESSEVTMVDGLPVTTAERTIIDLLRSHADAGHIGGVIADAERRDLITLKALAHRVESFINAYGVAPDADGRVLIDHLVGQAGARLRANDLKDAVEVAYEKGVLDSTVDETARRLAVSALTPVLRQLARDLPSASFDTPAMRESGEALRSLSFPMGDELAETLRELTTPLAAKFAAQMQEAIKGMAFPLSDELRENLRRLTIRTTMNADLQDALRKVTSLGDGTRQGVRATLQLAPTADRPRTPLALPAGDTGDEENEAEADQEDVDEEVELAAPRPDLGK
jgi:predicted transcriptional regulator of viral defense system